MVEYALNLDSIFSCLADPTRRDILQRVSKQELSVGEIARPYDLTFAAVSKHLKVLERTRLVAKQRRGKQQLVRMVPEAFTDVDKYLGQYRQFWESRFDSLEQYLKEDNNG